MERQTEHWKSLAAFPETVEWMNNKIVVIRYKKLCETEFFFICQLKRKQVMLAECSTAMQALSFPYKAPDFFHCLIKSIIQ